MTTRVLVVILSLVSCGREVPSPPVSGEVRAETEQEVAPQVDPTLPQSPPPAPARRRLRLIEHHGPADAPLTHLVIEPDDASARTSLVIALHGRGDSAEGFVKLARRLELDARVIVPDAPLPFGLIGGRQWFDMGGSELKAEVARRVNELVAFTAWLRSRYPEAAGVILLGFSQGGALVIEAIRTNPEPFGAAVALSGFGVGEGGVKADKPGLLVVAGTKDSIVPQERSWRAAAELEALGRKVERFTFAGPHAVPSAVVDEVRRFVDETLRAWSSTAAP
jgi:phospholipase/carboxylesterase